MNPAFIHHAETRPVFGCSRPNSCRRHAPALLVLATLALAPLAHSGIIDNSGNDIDGVTLSATDVLTNTGTITNTGHSVYASGLAVEVHNQAGALIEAVGTGNQASGIIAGELVATNAGVITGTGFGILIQTAGTVTNSGTIVGYAQTGVQSQGTLVLSNSSSGFIQSSGGVGVGLAHGGTVSNSGTIAGLGGGRDGIWSGGALALTNGAGALVQGSDNGVQFIGGTIMNSGAIVGLGGGGIWAESGALIENTGSGRISGATHGIWLTGGTIVNAGTIAADYGVIGYAFPVTVENTGLASGTTVGVYLDEGGVLVNTGTIAATAEVEGYGFVAYGEVTGTNRGTISGSMAGVWLGDVDESGTYPVNAGIVNEAGGTIIGGTYGIYVAAGTAVITNSGNILVSDTANGWGVYIVGGTASVTNAATGTIAQGVYAGGTVSVVNDGVITGQGVYLGTDSVFTGTGSILADTGTALTLAAGVSHTNAMTVTSSLVGVYLADAGALVNSGTITGTGNAGVLAETGSVFVTNSDAGLVTGGSYGARFAAGGTLVNSGTITGTAATSVGVYSATALTGTNLAGGLIQGGLYGLQNHGGTFFNSGIIHDTGAHAYYDSGTGGLYINSGTTLADTGIAVYFQGTGTFVNEAFGLVAAGDTGVQFSQGGKVMNAGVITGSGGVGVGLALGGTVSNSGTIAGLGGGRDGIWSGGALALTNSTGALVQGSDNGVQFIGGTIMNSGAIVGLGGGGIWAEAGALIENTGSGRISGATHGIWLTGGTIVNAGTIAADYGVIGYALPVTVENTGLASGTTVGVYLDEGGVLVNSGTIVATGTVEGYGFVAYGEVTGTNHGTISGSTAGMWLGDMDESGTYPVNASIANAAGGTITGGTYGIYVATGTAVVTNSGNILVSDTMNGWGVYIAGGTASVTNAATGTIAQGVYAGGTIAVVNNGVITGQGVYLGTDSTLTGTGSILSPTGTALILAAGVSHTNAMTVTGSLVGVYFEGAGTLVNTAAITGTARYGVLAETASVLVSNTAGALIQGATGVNLAAGGTLLNAGSITATSGTALAAAGGALSLLNTGTMTGDVVSTAAVASATLAAGGKIDGALALDGAASTLTLAVATGSQSHAAAVTGSTAFTGTLVKTGTGAWDLDAPAANLAGLAQKATLVQAGTLAVDWAAHQLNGAAAGAMVDAGAVLQINQTGTGIATISSTLAGGGYIDLVNTYAGAAGRFELAATTGGAFTGTLGVRGLTNTGSLLFNDNAKAALAGATLRLGALGSVTLDASGTIHGLDFAGGLFLVESATVGGTATLHALTVDALAGSSGTIGVATAVLSGLDLTPPAPTLTGGLFDTDASAEALNHVPVIKVTATGVASLAEGSVYMVVDGSTGFTISGSGSGRHPFYDASGDIVVGNVVNAYKGVYYGTASTGTAGIYLDYGVTSVESTHATVAVTLDPTGSVDKTLSLLLTGTGAGFTFTGTDTVTLAQKADYTGATLITGSAVLRAGVADAIASSTSVTLDGASTGFDLGGYDQTVHNLSGSGSIALGGNAFMVGNSAGFNGMLTGPIAGTGNFTLASGELTLAGANTYTGTTIVQSNATLTVGDGATSGALAAASRVSVAIAGTLAFWRSDATTISNTIATAAANNPFPGGVVEIRAGSGDVELGGPVTGGGTLVQNAAAATVLTGASDISLRVNAGTVQIGTGGDTGNGWATDTLARSVTLSGDDAKLVLNRSGNFTIGTAIAGAGGVDIIGGGITLLNAVQTYTGATFVRSDTLRAGAANVLAASSGLTLDGAVFDLAGRNQTLKALHGGAPVAAVYGMPAFIPAAATSGTILYHTAPGTEEAYATLTTGVLTGALTHHMNVDVAGRLSDKLRVTTLATGTHHIEFHRTTTTEIDDATHTYALDLIELPYAAGGIDPGLTITSGTIEMGAHTYQLYPGDGGSVMPGENTWYLSGGDARSRAGDAIYLTAGVAGLDWHYSLDSLRNRMSELRTGGLPENGNIWVTANSYRLNAGGGLAGDGFTQDSFGMTIGGDRRIDLSGDLTLLAGGFFSLARHERDFDHHGSGETSGFGVGGYATVLHKDGWYGDLVLRADRNSNKLHSQAVDGFVTDARYGSEAVGASLELGRRVASGNLWLEPSVQMALARFGSETYDTERQTAYSEPIHVRIDGSTAMQYRVQMSGGVDLGRWRPYLRAAEVKSDTSGGALHVEGREWTPGFDGWRFETGLGAGYLIDAQSQLYFGYEYNKADAYERPWSLSLGYHRVW